MKLVSRDEAGRLSLKALRERADGTVLVLDTTTGAGKTHVTSEYIAQESRSGRRFCVSLTNHKLQSEIEKRFANTHGVEVRYHRGPTSEVKGKAQCHPKKLPMARLAAESGLNVRQAVCKSCPYRKRCGVLAELREAEKSDSVISLCPREMVPAVVRGKKLSREDAELTGSAFGAAATLVVDEEVAPFVHEHISTADLAAAHDLSYLSDQARGVFQGLIEARRRGLGNSGLNVRAFDPQTPRVDPGKEEIAMAHEPTRRALHVFKWLLLGYGPKGTFGPLGRDGKLPATGMSPVLTHLCTHGGIVLSATPNVDMWEAMKAEGVKVEHVRLDVEDAQPTTRVWLKRSQSTKGHLVPKTGATSEWEALYERMFHPDHDFDTLLRGAPAGKRLLLITHKAIADDLAAQKDGLLFGFRRLLPSLEEVDVAYYKGLAGLDKWRDYDMCITLGDFWPSHGEQLDLARLTGHALDSEAHIASCRSYGQGELIQAHGRLRAPSRSKPLWLGHVGNHEPGWAGRDVVNKTMGSGRKKTQDTPSALEVSAVVTALGGPTKAAELSGRSRSLISSCCSGARSMKRDVYERLQTALRNEMAGLARAVDQGVVRRLSSRPPPPPARVA